MQETDKCAKQRKIQGLHSLGGTKNASCITGRYCSATSALRIAHVFNSFSTVSSKIGYFPSLRQVVMLGLGAMRYIMLKNDVGHWTDMFIVLVVRVLFFKKLLC